MTDPLARVRAALAQRDATGLRRVLRARGCDDGVIDLAGNDYLGLSRHPRVVEAAVAAARAWGAGATGSRLVTGTTELHAELEAELAGFLRAPAALVLSSGYLANLAVLTTLGGPDVTIVSDAANHASLIDGCRLSGSPITVVPHRDVDKAQAALAAVDTEHALLVTDSVFSVAGDLAPVRELHALARQAGAILVVDEAHAIGVVGPGGAGAVVAAGIAQQADVVRTCTLSKSLGAQGGVVAGHRDVIDLIVNSGRSLIFDTALAPPAVAAAKQALAVLAAEPGLVTAVRAHARELAAVLGEVGVAVTAPDAAVVAAVLGEPARALSAAAACLDEGIRVGCFRPPSVPTGQSCLRLSARATLSRAELDRAAAALRRVLG